MEEKQNPYVKQFPDLMSGKTMMYVHGFGSSGQSGTVTRLRTVFPNTRVVAPDLPVHPQEAIDLLHRLCETEKPDLILGTSMGGMYTEQLYGFDRICINPALCIADTMQAHGLTGTQTFQNPRLDGVQQFYVDKALVKEYRTVSEQRFSGISGQSFQALQPGSDSGQRFQALQSSDERRRVYGLFGDEDDVVDTYDLFREHYPQAMHFHGEHRMNDKSFMHSVVPVIRWIDDRQEGRERPIIYIGVETLLEHPHPRLVTGEGNTLSLGNAASSCQKAIRQLIEAYQVYFVAPAASSEPDDMAAVTAWLEKIVNVPAWGHTVFTNQRHLLYGDYLIETAPTKEAMATSIEFGSEQFKTWETVLDYFARLGGQ